MTDSVKVEFIGNPEMNCFSGQAVNGIVKLDLAQAVICKKLKVMIEGRTELHWSYSATLIYYDKVDHFTVDTILKEPNESCDSITLITGPHTFDFNFYIPSDCPSSFESSRGRTRFVVKVIFMKPEHNDTSTFPFTVVNPLNLNKFNANLKKPLSDAVTKKMWFGLSKNKVSLEATIRKGAYVVGDVIHVELNLSNTTTSVIIEEIAFRLVLKSVFTARMEQMNHIDRLAIASYKVPKEKIGKECVLSADLIVPPTLPTTVGICEIMEHTYSVDISTTVDSKMHSVKEIKLPVIIGVIPFGTVRKPKLVKTQSFSLDNYELGAPNFKIAAFMEACKNFTPSASKEIKEEEEEINFLPSYPKFRAQ